MTKKTEQECLARIAELETELALLPAKIYIDFFKKSMKIYDAHLVEYLKDLSSLPKEEWDKFLKQ